MPFHEGNTNIDEAFLQIVGGLDAQPPEEVDIFDQQFGVASSLFLDVSQRINDLNTLRPKGDYYSYHRMLRNEVLEHVLLIDHFRGHGDRLTRVVRNVRTPGEKGSYVHSEDYFVYPMAHGFNSEMSSFLILTGKRTVPESPTNRPYLVASNRSVHLLSGKDYAEPIKEETFPVPEVAEDNMAALGGLTKLLQVLNGIGPLSYQEDYRLGEGIF